MDIDLSQMSRKDLNELKTRIEKELVNAEMRELREARKAAEQAVAEFGFSLSDVAEVPTKIRKSRTLTEPKYADPHDPSKTWTGKGRQPQWFKDALAAGTDPSDMEI